MAKKKGFVRHYLPSSWHPPLQPSCPAWGWGWAAPLQWTVSHHLSTMLPSPGTSSLVRGSTSSLRQSLTSMLASHTSSLNIGWQSDILAYPFLYSSHKVGERTLPFLFHVLSHQFIMGPITVIKMSTQTSSLQSKELDFHETFSLNKVTLESIK